jgi:hypothetical protein
MNTRIQTLIAGAALLTLALVLGLRGAPTVEARAEAPRAPTEVFGRAAEEPQEGPAMASEGAAAASAKPKKELGAALPPRPASGRPEGEWQGMLIRADDTFPCLESVCGMARACIEERCVACGSDSDCGSGEACAMDHCVPAAQVECRRAADCGEPEAQCVLTGLTPGDPRGNRDLRAYCLSPSGSPEDEASQN